VEHIRIAFKILLAHCKAELLEFVWLSGVFFRTKKAGYKGSFKIYCKTD